MVRVVILFTSAVSFNKIMTEVFYAADVDKWVEENSEDDATPLAYEHCQKELLDMARHMRAFDKAFKKLQETFPDANMYSGSDGGLELLLGDSHNQDRPKAKAQQQRVVYIKNYPGLPYLSGGGW